MTAGPAFPQGSMYEALRATAMLYPDLVACSFRGRRVSYRALLRQIDAASRWFHGLGVRAGDRVTLCLPNSIRAVVSLYGLNRLGAVVCPVHPLSTPYELRAFLRLTRSRWAITLDLVWAGFDEVFPDTELERVIVHSIAEDLPPRLRPLYWLARGRKIRRPPVSARYLASDGHARDGTWDAPLEREIELPADRTEALAVILLSGGTTGTPKGVMLSNGNFNALAWQLGRRGSVSMLGMRVLGILPVFHGYGLGVVIHGMLCAGGTVVLVPTFTPTTLPRLILRERPNFLPTIPRFLEEIIRQLGPTRDSLAFLQIVNTGGDLLTPELQARFEALVRARGAAINVTVGYGLTETVAGCIASPVDAHRPGSLGKPLPGNEAKVVRLGSTERAVAGEEGEICIHGPTTMLGYLDDPEATASVLRPHGDGRTWLHTGDLGSMDVDGFVYFRQRIKRILKVSGLMVYPGQLEEVLDSHPGVAESCVVGVDDPLRGQQVVAFVVPDTAKGGSAGDELVASLHAHCRERLIRWRCPTRIHLRPELPRTRLGKVAYGELERAAAERQEGA